MEKLKTWTQCLLFVTYEAGQNIEDVCRSFSHAGRSKTKAFAFLPTFVSRNFPKLCRNFVRCGVQILTSKESPALCSTLRKNKVVVVELILAKGKHRHVSVEAGNVDFVNAFLGQNFRVSKTKCSPYSAIRSAADESNLDVLKNLLRIKADISYRNPRGGTLLHLAICRTSDILFKAVLEHVMFVNTRRKDGSTPLHLAVLNGNVEFARLLLKRHADVNARRNDGSTCLLLAADMKHEQVFELLLQSGATIPEGNEYVRLLRLAVKNISDSLVLILLRAESSSFLRGENHNVLNELLLEAVERRLSRVVQQLLEYGADASMETLDGRSILHLAVCKESPEMVENLLKFNSNLAREPQNKEALREAVLGDGENFEKITTILLQHGLTFDAGYVNDQKLLHAAIEKSYLQVVEQLLKSGLDASAKEEDYCEVFGDDTPLIFAVRCGNLDIMKLLLRSGADPNLERWQSAPLLMAVKNRSISAAKILLEHGAIIQPTVLNTAIKGKSGEVVEFLLQHGANPNAYDKHDWQKKIPIGIAVQEYNVELIDMLLKYGADINGCNKDGATALHTACDCGHAPLTVVEYLIRNNADIEKKDHQGFTALGYAAGKDHFEVVDMLLKSGARYNFRNVYGKAPANYDAFLAFLNHGFAEDELLNSFRYLNKAPGSGHYLNNYRFRKFSMRIARYLVKMEAAGLFYTELKPMPKWTCSEMTRSDFLSKCEAEIKSMKAEIVTNTTVPFYDFLTCGVRRLTSYARNEHIEKMLEAGDFIKKFPIYASIISCQLRKGVFQRDLLKEGTKIFHFVFKKSPKLPDDLVEQILSYLGNQGVMVFITAVSPMDISVQSESES